ncbi:hypothetical protein NDU88_002851 [Pleurodeles waltl]|uniref:Uncharacterized protein n=1 Tax=Pleurodeles waltl TaxID=8319 RepID=A0AAV7RD99_PLEWA|nr:hypothetical protein NDU88_002851 [Pleurodeles waltl]
MDRPSNMLLGSGLVSSLITSSCFFRVQACWEPGGTRGAASVRSLLPLDGKWYEMVPKDQNTQKYDDSHEPIKSFEEFMQYGEQLKNEVNGKKDEAKEDKVS